MKIKHNHSPFLCLKIGHSIMVFTLLFSVGVFVFITSSIKQYRDSTFDRMQLAINVLNGQITSTEKALADLLKVATDDCHDTQTKILTLMVKNPSAQSINLSKNNRIICSSYPKLINVSTEQIVSEPVSLMTSAIVAPGETIIMVQQMNQDYLAIATIYGYNFSGIIRLLGEQTQFHISTKQGWINAKGDLILRPNNDELVVKSELYPITISSDIDYFAAIITSIQDNPLTIILFAVIALLTSLFYFKDQEPRMLKGAIKRGIKNKDFKAYAQALINKDGNIVGCEILTRWRYHDTLVSPNVFIPIAEASGMVVPMTLELLDQIYLKCLQNKHLFNKNFHLAVNLCPSQLKKINSKELLIRCKKFSQHPDLKNIVLVLEITERQIISHDQETLDTIKRLNNIGIHVSIDDFGTGYSSLENLRDYKIDGLKIDKSFIDGFPNHALSHALIDNIIDLGTRLQARVTAEGIETEEQANYLINKNIDYLQGYYFHKPEPLDDFLRNNI